MEAGKRFIEEIGKKTKELSSGKNNSAETEPDSDSELKPRGFDWKSIFRSPPTTAVNAGEVLDIEPDQDMLLSGMDFFGEGAAFSSASQTKVRRAEPEPEPEPVNMQFVKRAESLPTISENRVMSPTEASRTKVELIGRTCDAKILTESMALKITRFLPLRLQFNPQWYLLYSIDQHGLSITTLFRLVKQKGPCLLIIKDTDEQVFGAFVTDSFESSPTYYGSGESFLFRFGDPSAIHVANDNSKLCVYSWSGKNHYITLCEPTFISVGGGNGKFGLWVDKDLDSGVSSTCATFDNEPLSGPNEQFNCLELEIWGLSTQ